MAAIAEAESSGNSQAQNPSGATGLWQILGNPFPGNAFDPLTNAKMAVAKYRSQGLGAWTTYTSGAYKQFLKGHVPPSANPGGSGSGSGNNSADATLTAAQGGSLLGGAGSLLHGAAVVLDRAFALFAPGQGWRVVFTLAAIVLLVMSFKVFTAGGVMA